MSGEPRREGRTGQAGLARRVSVADRAAARRIAEDMAKKDGVIAVSYTHLDVYKRQVTHLVTDEEVD